MTKKIDETLKKTCIEDKKISLKITKKNNSKNIKKVILETPILEKISKKTINKIDVQIKPEQNNLGSLNVVQNKRKIGNLNTSLKLALPTSNAHIQTKPKRTLKLSIEDTSEISSEVINENLIIQKPIQNSFEKKKVSINQNASFFYEPSIFERFDIEFSSANDVIDEKETKNFVNNNDNKENDSENFDFVSNDFPNENLESSEIKNNEEEYDFISTEMPNIYETNYSLENNIISDNIFEAVDTTKENNDNSNSTVIETNLHLENIADNNFFESSIPTVEDISNTSNSVFKEFSYEKQTIENSENTVVENVTPFTILNQPSTNSSIIENPEINNNNLNNLEVLAQPNTLVLPTVDENILNTQNLNISENIPQNIITLQSDSTLEIDDSNLSDEEIDKELDEVLGIENNNNESDDFSIEEYFGVTVNNNQDETNNIEEPELDDSSLDSLSKLEHPDVTSFSNLIKNFTQTISTLSNKISDLEANITENENNKKMRTDAYIENILNSSIDDIGNIDNLNLDDITIDDISLDDIDIDSLNIKDNENLEQDIYTSEKEEPTQSVENILMKTFNDSKIDNQMKKDLLSEVLSSDSEETNEYPQNEVSSISSDSDATSDLFKIIDSLSKTISDLENTTEKEESSNNKEIVEEAIEEIEPEEESLLPPTQYSVEEASMSSVQEVSSEKAINILINKDDIFSIEISNETYEIVTDFDGISVLSENIHISTPKNNFYVKLGEKYIEIHKQPDLFVVNTNFEDIEFANAINNITFAKKKNKIELNIKEAFKISSINKKIELSMLNTSIANLAGGQTQSNSDNSSVCDNKTLIINEETQKVYLPYTIEEVMKKLNNSSDYQSIQDVVDQEYTLPLSTFKMPIISRFKEAYRFMRVKEKSSIYAALDLAIELMFNSNLNPAIIRAAKDLKELNIYLDCLYENELEKFDCFKIIYKVLPKIQ